MIGVPGRKSKNVTRGTERIFSERCPRECADYIIEQKFSRGKAVHAMNSYNLSTTLVAERVWLPPVGRISGF